MQKSEGIGRVTRLNCPESFQFCSLQPRARRAKVKFVGVESDQIGKSIVNKMHRTPEKNRTENTDGTILEEMDQTSGDAMTGETMQSATLQQELEKEYDRLTRIRQDINKEKFEMQIEKENIARDKEQLEHERQQARNGGANAANNDNYAGLVRHLQTVPLDVKIPHFTDETNPIQFINELERYLTLKNVRNDQHLTVLENILDGIVRIWYEVAKKAIRTFDDFKDQFKKEFYSVPIQIRFRNDWSSKRYNVKEGSMTTFLYKQVRSAQYLEPKLPDHQVHLLVVQQFPQYIQDKLATVDFSNLGLVAQALSLLDVTREKSRESNSLPNQQQNHHNRYPRVGRIAVASNSYPVNRNPYQTNYSQNNQNRYDNRYNHRNHVQEQGNRNFRYNNVQLPDVRNPPPNHNTRSVNQHQNRNLN